MASRVSPWHTSPMRRILHLTTILLLTMGVLVSCGGEADKELASFQGEGFTVLMPGKPTRNEQTTPSAAGPLKTVIYQSSSRQKAYLVGHTDFPSSVKVDLAGALKGIATAGKGTPRDEVETTYQGFPARDARVEGVTDDNGKKGTSFLRMVNANNRMYQLQYIESGNLTTPPANFSEFVNSLKIG